ADGAEQARPVRMIGKDEPAIEAPSPPGAANPQQAGGERLLEAAEPLHPGRSPCSDWREDQLSQQAALIADVPRLRQPDAWLANDTCERLDNPVPPDRPIVDARDLRQQTLRLAQRVAEQDRRLLRVALPPGHDLARDGGGRVPAEQGERVRRLGDEDVAAQRLERSAGRIRLPLVISGKDPDARVALDSRLRASQHVPGGMQRKRHPTDRPPLAVAQRLDAGTLQPAAQQGGGLGSTEIGGGPRARVVAVRMREHRALHWQERIEVEPAFRAVEALLRF